MKLVYIDFTCDWVGPLMRRGCLDEPGWRSGTTGWRGQVPEP